MNPSEGPPRNSHGWLAVSQGLNPWLRGLHGGYQMPAYTVQKAEGSRQGNFANELPLDGSYQHDGIENW